MHAELGVTGPQRLVLRLIGHFGVAAPGDLAETLHVHPSSLTGSLRRLEQAGLIRRKRDPRDGRRALLTLTSQGRVLNEQKHGTVEASVQRALKRLSPEHLTVARKVLKILAAELGVAVN
jgi:DNA-binding MarR family transcriptional regulator